MGYRIHLLVPRIVGTDLINPKPAEIHKHLARSAEMIGGVGIEADLPLDEDFDDLYTEIFGLPSREAPWPVMMWSDDGYTPRSTHKLNGFGKIRVIESHHLAIALESRGAIDMWRNKAAHAYLSTMPPAVPIVVWLD